jgi:hypothetical protein
VKRSPDTVSPDLYTTQSERLNEGQDFCLSGKVIASTSRLSGHRVCYYSQPGKVTVHASCAYARPKVQPCTKPDPTKHLGTFRVYSWCKLFRNTDGLTVFEHTFTQLRTQHNHREGLTKGHLPGDNLTESSHSISSIIGSPRKFTVI